MRDEVKKAAIPGVAFDYQTLHGVGLLCEWLDAPTRYRRMKFECDDDAAPQGLDDIVVERADGLIDYLQVKYTPNPEDYALDWDWLLSVSGGPRARCLLRKWFDALAQIDVAKRGRIALVTNRIADPAIESCLVGGHIELARADDDTQKRVSDILGGQESAVAFFKALEIVHSDKNFSNLGFHVYDRLARYTDRAGAQRLLDAASRWAAFKNQPEPDGWITLMHVEAEISRARPRPIPQDFAIPAGYTPPDAAFHEAMKRTIAAVPTEPIVLTGPPGRGKSTYLSYLCEELMQAGTPVIRHHYFLSITDREDRLTSSTVIQSLKQQLEDRFGTAGATSRDTPVAHALKVTAAAYKPAAKPLLIVLDGLDHVWREYHADKRPLDDVFSQLLPLPENVVLIVGTQPVADEQLPTRLLTSTPRTEWQVLPGMSPAAVSQYLENQVDGNRLKPTRADALVESAAELHELTHGHPLSVIYATEMLVTSGGRLDAWAVEQLPIELGESTQRYYSELWARLKQPQRDILHLVCELELLWPAPVFYSGALGITDDGTNLRAVSHLLHTTAAGLTVFHDSLRVFVNATDEHAARLAALLQRAKEWLSSSAPPRLREAWLWAVEARLGDTQHLVDGLTRDWILDRMADGHRPGMPIELLRQAEKIAFRARQFGKAYRLRHLKYRLDNGPEFAMEDITRLQFCTWAVAAKQDLLDEITAESARLSMRQEAALGLALHLRGQSKEAFECIDQARRRHNASLRFRTDRQRSESDRDTEYLGYVLGATNGIRPEVIDANHLLNKAPVSWLIQFLSGVAQSQDLAYLMAVRKQLKPTRRRFAESAGVRAAAVTGARIEAWSQFSDFRGSTLAACWAGLCGQAFDLPANRIDTDWTDRSGRRQGDTFLTVASEWFFKSVATSLASEGREFCWRPCPSSTSRDSHEVSGFMDALTGCAEVACASWRAGDPFGFDAFLTELETRCPPTGLNSWKRFGDPVLRRVALHIAFDCGLLRAAINGAAMIDVAELDPSPARRWVTWDQLVDAYNERQLRQLSDAAATRLLERGEAQLANMVQETNELVARWLALSETACRHELRDQTAAATRTCWDFVLGYGHHKDPTIIESLQALDHLGVSAPEIALGFLRRLSGQVHHITEYTDGDETRHAHAYANDILAQHDVHGLAVKYATHIDEFDWKYADDALASRFRVSAHTSLLERIARTALPPDALHELKKRADANGAKLYASARSFLGAPEPQTEAAMAPAHLQESSLNDPPSKEPPDASLYPPERFEELSRDLRDMQFFGGYEYYPRWFAFWVSQGKKQELLESLRTLVLDEDVDRDLAHLLDPMFELSLELEGAAKAFPFVVAAQRELGGWGSYMEREEVTERRLERVATLYPARAEEFLDKTCVPWLRRRRDDNIVVPNDKLVFFLVKLGRVDDAVDLCESIVSSLEGDTHRLPLTRPRWGNETTTDPSAGDLEFLVARLRWPAPSVRWWTVRQLAELLVQNAPGVADRLRRRLRECRTEIEVTHVLAIFQMAKDLGASIPADLGNDIELSSPASRQVLERMSIDPTRGVSRPFVAAAISGPSGSADAKGPPELWNYVIDSLEEATRRPFRARFLAEWDEAKALFPCGRLFPDYRYFFGSRLEQMSGFFADPQADRAHTAFIRTLEIAKEEWGAPDDFLDSQLAEYERSDTTLSLLLPQTPAWLHPWNHGAAPTEEAVRAYVQRMLQQSAFSHGEVLAASLPVSRSRNRALDLDVVMCSSEDPRGAIDPLSAERVFSELFGSERAKLSADRPQVVGQIVVEPDGDKLAAVVPWGARSAAGRVNWFPLRGHMQGELLLRGLLSPRAPVPVEARAHAGSLRFFAADRAIATFTYWISNWEPVYPTRLKPALGCALQATGGDDPREILLKGRRFYTWRCRSTQREQDYDPFEEAEWFGLSYLPDSAGAGTAAGVKSE